MHSSTSTIHKPSPRHHDRVELFNEHVHDGRAYCPTCGGDGEYETEGRPGGVWNRQIGTWEPDWRNVPCEACGGEGITTVPRCDRCGLVPSEDYVVASWDFCECDEDVLEAWAVTNGQPEVSTAVATIKEHCRTHYPTGGRAVLRTGKAWADRIRDASRMISNRRDDSKAETVLAAALHTLATNLEREVAA